MLDISIHNIEPDKHKIIARGPYLCEMQDQQTCWDEKRSVLEVIRNFLKVHGLYYLPLAQTHVFMLKSAELYLVYACLSVCGHSDYSDAPACFMLSLLL